MLEMRYKKSIMPLNITLLFSLNSNVIKGLLTFYVIKGLNKIIEYCERILNKPIKNSSNSGNMPVVEMCTII